MIKIDGKPDEIFGRLSEVKNLDKLLLLYTYVQTGKFVMTEEYYIKQMNADELHKVMKTYKHAKRLHNILNNINEYAVYVMVFYKKAIVSGVEMDLDTLIKMDIGKGVVEYLVEQVIQKMVDYTAAHAQGVAWPKIKEDVRLVMKNFEYPKKIENISELLTAIQENVVRTLENNKGVKFLENGNGVGILLDGRGDKLSCTSLEQGDNLSPYFPGQGDNLSPYFGRLGDNLSPYSLVGYLGLVIVAQGLRKNALKNYHYYISRQGYIKTENLTSDSMNLRNEVVRKSEEGNSSSSSSPNSSLEKTKKEKDSSEISRRRPKLPYAPPTITPILSPKPTLISTEIPLFDTLSNEIYISLPHDTKSAAPAIYSDINENFGQPKNIGWREVK